MRILSTFFTGSVYGPLWPCDADSGSITQHSLVMKLLDCNKYSTVRGFSSKRAILGSSRAWSSMTRSWHVSPSSGEKQQERARPLPSSFEAGLVLLRQQLQEHKRQTEVSGPLESESEAKSSLSRAQAKAAREELVKQSFQSMTAIRERIGANMTASGSGSAPALGPVDPTTLREGEVVVHKRVGIGRFVGKKWEAVTDKNGNNREVAYIYLQYADGLAKLKESQAQRLLYRYRSPIDQGRAPALSRLRDTRQWEERKSKGRRSIQRMVVGMMELYALRLQQRRPCYPPDDPALLAKFCEAFPHRPTVDQEEAFRDVARDMLERETPMDRLICGDVGFGKTEVALRAIFRAVMDGRQAMVLAPTTVLARQHFHNIKERFAAFPDIQVAVLSRFQKESEKREVIRGIHSNKYNIVVGTHALLGSQIRYQNLGLLVIDEEQRFGVRQKERIMSLKTTVDVLTLSATPIPRTLYLALCGFRDASLITVGPPERRPIVTHLLEFDPKTALRAIHTELKRGGQVYYVVPRVKGIDERREFLETNLPHVAIDVAHGKIGADELENTMERFSEGEISVLLCTSIIESGLDVAQANTVVVEDVQMFGLAQLYQLRGRVGRAEREAHAYLFYPQKGLLSDEALERLVALDQCCGLGQGFRLAERDMAIRGVGNIFGDKQSGDVARIGVDLYLEMLYDALANVEDLRLPSVEFEEVELSLNVDLAVDPVYVAGAADRLRLARDAERTAGRGLGALLHFTDSMRESLGPWPQTMEAFFKALYVRVIASELGIRAVHSRRGGATVVMETLMGAGAFEILRDCVTDPALGDGLSFQQGTIEWKALVDLTPERKLDRVFQLMVEMRNALPSFVRSL